MLSRFTKQNPLSGYRIFKNIKDIDVEPDDYKKFQSLIFNMDKYTVYFCSTTNDYIEYYKDIFNIIHPCLNYVYELQDLQIFTYLRNKINWLVTIYGIQQFKDILKKFGFMCNATSQCSSLCDNYICPVHIELYLDMKITINDCLYVSTSLQIDPVNHVIFDYYFEYRI